MVFDTFLTLALNHPLDSFYSSSWFFPVSEHRNLWPHESSISLAFPSSLGAALNLGFPSQPGFFSLTVQQLSKDTLCPHRLSGHTPTQPQTVATSPGRIKAKWSYFEDVQFYQMQSNSWKRITITIVIILDTSEESTVKNIKLEMG